MFERIINKYEVSGWRDASNPQRPDEMELFDNRRDARACAKDMNRRCELVEITRIEIDADNEESWLGGYLVASWSFGKKTA